MFNIVHVVHMKVLHNVLHKCQHLVHDIVARRSAEPSRVQDMCKTCARHVQDMGKTWARYQNSRA